MSLMNNTIYELANEVVRLLKEKKLTAATAESCTGGLLSAYITAVPGSSSVFELGITSYSCRIKNELLGVDNKTLDTLGAVSGETARQMADNVRKKACADIGLSVTGVAGPDGSEGHEPGLVYIAAATESKIYVKELNIDPLGRNYVRESAVSELLRLTVKIIKEELK